MINNWSESLKSSKSTSCLLNVHRASCGSSAGLGCLHAFCMFHNPRNRHQGLLLHVWIHVLDQIRSDGWQFGLILASSGLILSTINMVKWQTWTAWLQHSCKIIISGENIARSSWPWHLTFRDAALQSGGGNLHFVSIHIRNKLKMF